MCKYQNKQQQIIIVESRNSHGSVALSVAWCLSCYHHFRAE